MVLRLAADHEATTGGLTRALECGAIDEVIEPAATRERLIAALQAMPATRGRRANGPL
jgi:acetyl-CoA/propionyl-CoA carboxylase carboxyl transferase subunit